MQVDAGGVEILARKSYGVYFCCSILSEFFTDSQSRTTAAREALYCLVPTWHMSGWAW